MPFPIRPCRRFPGQCAVTYIAALTALLILSGGPAYAEWVLVNGLRDAGLTVYVDPSTIRHKGNVVKWWELLDFKTDRKSVV